jgi:hypothetical protein
MVYEIEKILGAHIERRQLSDFDYGSFKPEHDSHQRRSSQPRQAQSHYQREQGRSHAARSKPSARSRRKPTQSPR